MSYFLYAQIYIISGHTRKHSYRSQLWFIYVYIYISLAVEHVTTTLFEKCIPLKLSGLVLSFIMSCLLSDGNTAKLSKNNFSVAQY